VRLAGRAVGGVANCDKLKSLDPGVRMLRGDSGLGDASACKPCTASSAPYYGHVHPAEYCRRFQ